jgi:V/A-type H+-transporting ATPase subunit A
LKLESARSLREDFLQQDSFDEIDTYCSLNKQYKMLSIIMKYYYAGSAALGNNASYNELVKIPARYEISRFKSLPEDQVDERFERISRELEEQINAVMPQGV